jgi:preprotein translocase SecE subunit
MPDPVKVAPKKTVGSKPVDPKIVAAQERIANLSKGVSGAPKPPSQFFKETWRELKMTTWPDRPTLEKSTYVVLAFIAATAVFTGIIDYVLGRATSALIGS